MKNKIELPETPQCIKPGGKHEWLIQVLRDSLIFYCPYCDIKIFADGDIIKCKELKSIVPNIPHKIKTRKELDK